MPLGLSLLLLGHVERDVREARWPRVDSRTPLEGFKLIWLAYPLYHPLQVFFFNLLAERRLQDLN